jgi:hypothetical protein
MELFMAHDLVGRIVESLALSLNEREHRALKHDVPASALAYEFYLRANHLVSASYDVQSMGLAQDLYLRSIELDKNYAPAWACLGKTHHYIAKFSAKDAPVNLAAAEEAFEKAFKLSHDLAWRTISILPCRAIRAGRSRPCSAC